MKFDATTAYADTITAMRAGSKAIASLLKLSKEQLDEIALVATAKAATKTGYADWRLLAARITWHAGEARKAGKPPEFVLRSRTSKDVVTVYACAYTYNENKASKSAATAATPAATPAAAADSATDSAAVSDPATDPASVIAALQSQIDTLTAELIAERAAHASTQSKLDQALIVIASASADPARLSGKRSQRHAQA